MYTKEMDAEEKEADTDKADVDKEADAEAHNPGIKN